MKTFAQLPEVTRCAIRDWLRTPAGNWPETQQAWKAAYDGVPSPAVPSAYKDAVPEAEWHPSRRRSLNNLTAAVETAKARCERARVDFEGARKVLARETAILRAEERAYLFALRKDAL